MGLFLLGEEIQLLGRRGRDSAAATGGVGGMDVLLALGAEALEEDGGRLVVRVLGDEFTAEGLGEDGALLLFQVVACGSYNTLHLLNIT
jgi:hypothetical protein